MSEETNVDAGLMMIEDEQMTEKEDSQEKNSPSEKQSTVILTGEKLVRVVTPDRAIGKEGSGLSELGISPLESFQSLQSTQCSERDKMIPYVPPLEEVKVVQFEDTPSEEDCKNFNLIYESLLLENLWHGSRSCMKG